MTSKRRLMTPWFFAHFLMALILCPVIVSAATIRVPTDQPTIQAGIDAAVAGDTVLVADGTYTGVGNKDIDFKGKAITVQSENGAENCIIDCEEDNARAFYFHTGENQTSVLSGFTVTRSGYSGAICCDGSSPTIIGCKAIDNAESGIYCRNSSSPKIENCTIKKNIYYGIQTFESSPTITGCTIENNGSSGISCWGESSPVIINCSVVNNDGSGISCGSGLGSVTDCTISVNEGVGIYCRGDTIVKNCLINENKNGGIYCKDGSSSFINCIIKNNFCIDNGGAIDLYECVSTNFTNCLITGNTSYKSGGALYSYSSAPIFTNCTISGNTAASYGGLYFSSGLPVIKNTIIYSNSPDQSRIGSSVTVNYSDIAGYSGPGTGNIDENPSFTGNNDYHLLVGSPCINTGTSLDAPNTDIEGNSRPQGSAYDMGAYEYTGAGHIEPTANAGPNQRVFDSITLDGSGSVDPDGSIVSYLWQLKYQGNSGYDRTATGVSPTVSTLQPGFYDVTLTVTDNQGLTDTDAMLFSAIGIKGDFNGDGDVDGSDLQIFSTNYGK
jgi:parallel beta-helix repeat protein